MVYGTLRKQFHVLSEIPPFSIVAVRILCALTMFVTILVVGLLAVPCLGSVNPAKPQMGKLEPPT